MKQLHTLAAKARERTERYDGMSLSDLDEMDDVHLRAYQRWALYEMSKSSTVGARYARLDLNTDYVDDVLSGRIER